MGLHESCSGGEHGPADGPGLPQVAWRMQHAEEGTMFGSAGSGAGGQASPLGTTRSRVHM